MGKIKNNGRVIPKKNYIYLSLILIVTLALLYVFYSFFSNNNLSSPIMDRYLQVINYNELSDYILDNKNVVIYTSVLNDEDTRNFEVKFRNIVNSYDLHDVILYLNLNEVMNNDKDRKSAKELYSIDNKNITQTPNVLLFKNGSLIDIYNIKSNNYDTKLLVEFLKENGIIES